MTNRTLLGAALLAATFSAHAADPALPGNLLKSHASADLTIPAADVAALAEEDSKARGVAMRYGMPQRVDRPLLVAGEAQLGAWQALPDGRAFWSAQVASEGAVSLDLHFSRFQLPEGAELYLANADGSYVLGPIRGSDALASGEYYTALIPGDTMRVEIVVPAAQQGEVDLRLASVTYGYRGLFGNADHPDAIRSGACNIDVACPLGDNWRDQIDAVGQYIFQDGGSYVCTGSLVGNTEGTPEPYFITANHCVSSNTVANTMRVYWKYESPTCRAPGSGASGSPLPRPATFNNGATLRMTYASNDTSLVELNAPVPESVNPFFLGWDRRNLAVAGGPQVSGAVTIHHPAGHEKRISRDADSLTVTSYLQNAPLPNGTHYRIGNWEEGTTEGGSSGSALFTPQGHLIGTLHGGYASCSSNTSDWYGRIYQSWNGGGSASNSLAAWLDPEGTAPEIFDGYRAGEGSSADVSIASISASPNPVDIGEVVTIEVDVENDGPDVATNVTVELELPAGIDFDNDSSPEWTCEAAGSTATCSFDGDVGNGQSIDALVVTAWVNAKETGTVEIAATIDATETDPDTTNNTASVELEITGTPPLPDCIFGSGFEEGDDGSCTPATNPDIVDSGKVDIAVPASIGEIGFAINWITGATCNCDTDVGFHFNPYEQTGGQLSFWFWPGGSDPARGGLGDGTKFLVLQAGDTVGPDGTFMAPGGVEQPTAMTDWRAGADGYLGFRFTNGETGEVNYGYAQLQTTAGGGFPMTIVRYWYNRAGDPITIR
jgi:lysyl endopeptidase